MTKRIVVNALSARLGGGQTYIRNLLQNIPEELNLEVHVLVSPSLKLEGLPDCVSLILVPNLDNPIKRALWECIYLNRVLLKLGAHVYFSPGGLLYKGVTRKVKKVVTFQNMLPFSHEQRERYPLGYRRLRDWLLERGFQSSMEKADLTIFISKFARNFIESKIKFSELSLRIVIPHGLDKMFRKQENRILPRVEWLSNVPYILYVSFIDYYKAQIEVVQGFDIFRRTGGNNDIKLVLAGPEYALYGDLLRHEIQRLGLQSKVILAGNVPHDELPSLYQGACWNVFASECENCPNILMEALASHSPVICSNRDPMPEFACDAVEYFEPRKPETLALAMMKFQNKPDLAKACADRAVANMNAYSWVNTAAKTWNAISDIGGSKF